MSASSAVQQHALRDEQRVGPGLVPRRALFLQAIDLALHLGPLAVDPQLLERPDAVRAAAGGLV